jgi:hypothetical protein
MRLIALTWTIIVLATSIAMADERRSGFFDIYGGPTVLLESDVPGWKFADVKTTAGARTGLWINDNWAVTLRVWYFQTDAKQRESSPSDLAFIGLSLELLGRWQLDRRWAIYGALGPAMAINTLDVQRIDQITEDDARSLAPGVSAAAGLEAHILGRFSAFTEVHGGLVYPSFGFSHRTVSPRLLHLDGVLGVRVAF